jgi:hypothetical protein
MYHKNEKKTNGRGPRKKLKQYIGFRHVIIHSILFYVMYIIYDKEHHAMSSSKISHKIEREAVDLQENANLYHGRVLTELCGRILHRDIAQSNVLIVSPDIVEKAKIVPRMNKTDFNTQGPSKIVLKISLDEEHNTHLLPVSADLNMWLEDNLDSKWFLMAYFIPGNSPSESIDVILHPDRAQNMLDKTTMTYIVIAIKSNIFKNTDNKVRMEGLTAVQTLLDNGFKVQLLASSHFFGVHPNHLFKEKADVKAFLSSGAIFSQNGSFNALLFATQGLDLAIPSRQSYIQLDRFCGNTCTNVIGRCDSKLEARALGDDIFISCPQRHENISIEFDDSYSEGVRVSLDGEIVEYVNNEDVELWFGHKDPKSSEAACVRIRDTTLNSDRVSCTTRILNNTTSSPHISEKGKEEGVTSRPKYRYNVLSILIDPISRFQFQRSLPNTALLLKTLNFTSFEKYTAVGDNSGPNQCALFTGYPLSGGREGIISSQSHTKSSPKLWLWDLFNAEGFVTLKTEDICIKNSNMVQSMKPKTTHGEQLFEMFCFDFDRPNCLGKDLMAKHVIDYAKKFIKLYDKSDEEGSQPWAAFISFVDSHEDTLTLISYIDELLVEFLQKIDLSNTIVVFSSDHGLHYGPSFLSNGEVERAQPILYLHVPQSLDLSHNLKKNQFLYTTPFDVHETILDVSALNHEYAGIIGNSLLKALPKTRESCKSTPGIPKKFCDLFQGQERKFSKIAVTAVKKPVKEKQCSLMHEPPSVNSFYADIPRENRPSWPKCTKEKISHVTGAECRCATSGLKDTSWQPCNSEQREKNLLENDLNMMTCWSHKHLRQTMEININIKTDKELADNYKAKKAQIHNSTAEIEEMPNILFLEIDSVSHSAALRHLPKTISIIRSHQIISSVEKGPHCPSGFCAAMFNKTSILGQNSIPNQLAALSGCSKSKMPGIHSYERKPINTHPHVFHTHCPEGDIENPWLFDIAEKLGYVTFFGEEFCYTGSPYVTQGNHFELNADYDMNKLFCRLDEATKQDTNIFEQTNDKESSIFFEQDTATNPQPCVDGRSRQEFAFEYIKGIWNAYPDVPKFAFLNSLAAHDYSIDTAYRQLGLEAYDDLISEFLKEMLSRRDAKKTVIVLRSDHGIQGGPAPIDYSTQVEHMNPFNTLIVPEGLNGLSLKSLFSNQERLVTGFDLYHTLRGILTPSLNQTTPKGKKEMNGLKGDLKKWSYNLLAVEVPDIRTCKDARIPYTFCPCIQERFDLMPYFYVGHSELLASWKDGKLEYNETKRILEPKFLPGRPNNETKYSIWC